jgi:hypothetical protein
MNKDLNSCSLCGYEIKIAFQSKILNKYDISYFHCERCDLLSSEKPFWLDEAYNQSISATDTGIMERNLFFIEKTVNLLSSYKSKNRFFYLLKFVPLFIAFRFIKTQFNKYDFPILDLGGGYGIFVRILRDIGIDAYWHDPHTVNLLANGFGEEHMNSKPKVICAFEVLEHLESPLAQIQEWLKKYDPDMFVFSTLLKKEKVPNSNWWYYSFDTGQHISFYSIKTLEYIGKMIGYKLYSDNQSYHVFSKKEINANSLYLNSRNSNKLFLMSRSLYSSKTISDSLLMKIASSK